MSLTKEEKLIKKYDTLLRKLEKTQNKLEEIKLGIWDYDGGMDFFLNKRGIDIYNSLVAKEIIPDD